MTGSQVVMSLPARHEAVDYVSEILEYSPLALRAGRGFLEHGSITLVTASNPPSEIDYSSDLCIPSCADWLIDNVVDYLKQSHESVVLFEDIVSSPSDAYFRAHDHPPYWCYQDRVFWPAKRIEATHHTVGQVMSWSGGFRVIAWFSRFVGDTTALSDSRVLSHTEMQQIASSISRVVTDVFGGGGYLVWDTSTTAENRNGKGDRNIKEDRSI